MYLPVLSYGEKTANGFRTNQKGWWFRDKRDVFNTKDEIGMAYFRKLESTRNIAEREVERPFS